MLNKCAHTFHTDFHQRKYKKKLKAKYDADCVVAVCTPVRKTAEVQKTAFNGFWFEYQFTTGKPLESGKLTLHYFASGCMFFIFSLFDHEVGTVHFYHIIYAKY